MKHHRSKHRPLLTIFFVSCLMICLFAATYVGAGAYSTDYVPDAPIDVTPDVSIPNEDTPNTDGIEEIDGQYYAYYIDKEGNVIDRFTITLMGYVVREEGVVTDIYIKIDFPKGFRHLNCSYAGQSMLSYFTSVTPYLVWCPGDYDCELNRSGPATYALSPDGNYFIGTWYHDDYYLVAASDPERTAEDVVSYFGKYVQSFQYNILGKNDN